jgi:NAD(P)-dependent dehydrogenase (short-subunit alcohol dehydrogenase family)
MNGNFEGQVVLVAGGSGALGRAVVNLFVERGARVVAIDRDLPREGAGNPKARYSALDVLDEQQIGAFFQGVEGCDVLVNTIGGYAAGDPVERLDLLVLESQLDLNLKSAFLLTKHAVRAMSSHGGKIIHVASRAAVDSGANSFAYSVSKLGVLRLVEAAAAENRGRNININCVLPSIIDTPANRSAMPEAAYDRWPKPEQIARVIAFLASEDAELISGAAIPVYGRA